ncbi:TetR/AcrR family transcriptional regulator [Streptomyces radicis]|uniref:TetR/AcrR family transcriptional regulator n=1 Tax=Streptomyces radicis TaxID=1750517 RepID=A0A3A9W3D7_9ACTN|nr:TetR/AcrR family transcriptional regulator [Streptomyces radicis]RKN03724.1 TetR/AcrR family transcriptional regulator [Streptomyces radicis]RKN13650.1 TetR/AcrR family transcriptional regulator [Streptomyces radicis]
MAGARVDGRVARGNQTRRLVLGRTMDIASVEGLDGLSIGRVATELGLSKSGVFALFGSKEEMQLATIRAARAVYARRVVHPAEEVPPGVGRVRELCASYLAYSRGRTFRGGCFFTAVAAEFSARDGAVRDAVAAARAEWIGCVRGVIQEARDLGELRADVDVPQLAFELAALLEMANADSVLHRDDGGYGRAARAIDERLAAATPGG